MKLKKEPNFCLYCGKVGLTPFYGCCSKHCEKEMEKQSDYLIKNPKR